MAEDWIKNLTLPRKNELNQTSRQSSNPLKNGSRSSYCSVTTSTSNSSDYEWLSTSQIISFMVSNLTDILNRNRKTAKSNKSLINTSDIWYLNKMPNWTIEQYLNRIVKYTKLESPTLISAFIILKHLMATSTVFLLNNNVYNCLWVVSVLSIKFNEDSNFKNSYYSKIAGVCPDWFNKMEYDVYTRLNFNMCVQFEEYQSMFNEICNWTFASELTK